MVAFIVKTTVFAPRTKIQFYDNQIGVVRQGRVNPWHFANIRSHYIAKLLTIQNIYLQPESIDCVYWNELFITTKKKKCIFPRRK
jgi:hypothetical protein